MRPFLHTFFQNFSLSWNLPGRNPKYARGGDGIDSPSPPPGDFVSEAVVVPVMGSAQRYRELVADLAPHRAGLCEPQMVGVCGASAADQTRLRGHEYEVGLVAVATWLADGELAFLDFGGTGFGLERCLSWRVVIDRRLLSVRSRWLGDGLNLSRTSPWPLGDFG